VAAVRGLLSANDGGSHTDAACQSYPNYGLLNESASSIILSRSWRRTSGDESDLTACLGFSTETLVENDEGANKTDIIAGGPSLRSG
jgi:hypothetical protein